MKAVFLILILACSTFAQQLTPEQIANQRLGKALDVIAAQDQLLEARKAEIAAKDDQIRLQTQLIESLKIQNNLLLQQNTDLSKLKANTFSLFFGLVKFKRFK